MCSRFENDAKPTDLKVRFDLADLPVVPNVAEVRPTDRALAVGPKRLGALAGFGIPAPWDGKPLINARAETLAEKPTFRPYLNRRVLIPATGYLEWRKDGKVRHKNHIHMKSKEIFAFAGLLEKDRFTIVTCRPAAEIAHVHDRMPVILSDREAESRWLDPKTDFAEVAGVLAPLEGGRLEAVEDEAA